MNHKTIIAVQFTVIIVLICIILWPTEQAPTNNGANEVYKKQISNLLKENDSLKSAAFHQAAKIDSLNAIKNKPNEDNRKRHERIDSIPDDSLDNVLYRMLDSLSSELNSR